MKSTPLLQNYTKGIKSKGKERKLYEVVEIAQQLQGPVTPIKFTKDINFVFC